MDKVSFVYWCLIENLIEICLETKTLQSIVGGCGQQSCCYCHRRFQCVSQSR